MRIHYPTQSGTETYEATLEELEVALAEVQRRLLAEGRVAVGVRVGDEVVAAEPVPLADHLRGTGGDIEDLHVEAQAVDSLAWDAARSAREYMDRLLRHAPALADDLYAGAVPEGLTDLFEGLEWLVQFLAVGASRLPVQPAGLAEVQHRLSGALLRLDELDGTLDTTFLADTLLYEIIPAMEALRDMIENLLGEDAS